METSDEHKKKRSQSFNTIASQYSRYRPGYPQELIDLIMDRAGVSAESRILEIGSGPGTATIQFAKRNSAILCVEPGEQLIETAKKNLASYPNIRFINSRFEDWIPETNAFDFDFDFVFSASAWHWIPKESGYPKVAQTLKSKKWFSVLWNRQVFMDSPIQQDINEVYEKYFPVKKQNTRESFENNHKEVLEGLAASGYFDPIESEQSAWSTQMNGQEYLQLIGTYSDHILLSDEVRKVLYDGILQAFSKHGDQIIKEYITVAYLAQKRE